MGNVNTLMTELADAVRLKSGESGEMTIRQMITAMAGITVSEDLGFTSGSFSASSTGNSRVVTHGLGHKPGAILFIKKGSYDSSSSLIPSSSTTGYDALVSLIFGEDSGHVYCYGSVRKQSTGSGSGTTTTTSRSWSSSSTTPTNIFGTGSVSNYYVTNINETTFTTPKGLVSGRTYFWIAFRAPLM